MSAHAKTAQEFARQLLKLSLDGGSVSAERVAGVLAYVEKHRPANPTLVLKAYRRLIAAELSRSQAVVEHAGALPAGILQAISAALGRKHGRTVTATAQPNPTLIAGLRVRLGDDVYESSIAGQLAALAASV
jgi:F-type H+-transporting ATPase subunit delta